MQHTPIPPRNARKKRSIWPWALLCACFLVAAVAGAIFASSGLLDKPRARKDAPKEPRQEELLTAHDKATIMIMGVDERSDDVGRSDTLMIATLDPLRERAALLSIPRDTRVSIRGHGYDKINAAYAYGGESLAQSTVESFLGLDIDHYVIVNTRSFVKIIDAIGGIDILVEKRMYYEDPWDDGGGLIIDLYPGLQHMDGKTAVTYVRYRDEEGDIGRIKRQQGFMRACMDKVASPSILPKLPAIVGEVMDSVRTDLSLRQLLEFAGTLREAQKNGLVADMVPGRPLYIDGISYWIPDVEDLRLSVAETLGVTVNQALRSNFERAAREYRESIPSSARELPSDDTSIGRPVPAAHSPGRSQQREEARPAEPARAPSAEAPARERQDGRPDETAPSGGERPGLPAGWERAEPSPSSNSPVPGTGETAGEAEPGQLPEGVPAYGRTRPAQMPGAAPDEAPSRSGEDAERTR